MKLIKQPNDWSGLLTCYAMIMERSINELIYLLKHDGSEVGFIPSELDFVATTLGWAPVHLICNLDRKYYPPIAKIIRQCWPNKMILTREKDSIVYDPMEEYFYDPRHGLRQVSELPTFNYITIFYWAQQHYEY